jgi:hypothetical protein
MTGPHGNLRTPFSVPAAPLGAYPVTLTSSHTLLRSIFRVDSHAGLAAAAVPTAGGDRIIVHGRGFLPETRVSLIAYPLFAGAQASTLAVVRTNARGRLVLRVVNSTLQPGEYQLSAYSVDTFASKLAQTFFEVTV